MRGASGRGSSITDTVDNGVRRPTPLRPTGGNDITHTSTSHTEVDETEPDTMNDGTADEINVSFPASPVFTRIGRVAVAGLALRLGVDIATVERLRSAVDTSVNALLGPGRISMLASWRPDLLSISLSNPDARIGGNGDLVDELNSLIGNATVSESAIVLELET